LLLGKLGAPKKFIIQTGITPGAMGKQNILDGMKKSLEDLGTDSVCAARFARGGRLMGLLRSIFTIFTHLTQPRQLKIPSPRSRNYMRQEGSREYKIPLPPHFSLNC
jgi:hypothetical protein